MPPSAFPSSPGRSGRVHQLARAIVVLLGVGASVHAQTPSSPAQARLDASLALVAGQPTRKAAQSLPAAVLRTAPSEAEPTVAATIRFDSDAALPALRALGVRVGAVIGPIATADIPLTLLRKASEAPGVVFIEAAKPIYKRLSASVPATGAAGLRAGTPMNWTGATGAGVVVGIVDDGLDFRHGDFRKADGGTRLLGLWDMRESITASPPAGFTYGYECTPARINQAIEEGPTSTACSQPSTGNHGTHVGGIAAGNGQATGNGQAAFRLVGMAPLADIVAVNAIAGGVNNSNAVINGVTYVKAIAAAAGKPAVINLSLGSYLGNSRDGTSNYETALTAAGGPGAILVGAAGNEGSDPIRAVANLANGESVTVGYSIPSGKTGTVELWYPGANRWSVRVAKGDCKSDLIAADTPSYSVTTDCGEIGISNNAVSPLNDDRQIRVVFSGGASGQSPAGAWQITVQSVQGAGTVNMYGGEDGNGGVFTDHTTAVTSQILTDTCTATGVICVGAYVTRQEWTTLGGAPASNAGHGPIGDVANFSSRGPRRNCSNLSKCPAVLKPEIVAPGAMIMSALGRDAKDDPASTTRDVDGVHIAYNGTSMATPHVAGAVALLLQKMPQMTPSDVRAALFGNLQKTSFTPNSLPVYDPAVPNPSNADYAWGYGMMDIARAYASVGTGGTPTTAGITAQVNDAASGLTLAATIVPKASEAGQTLQVFVVALLPNGSIVVNDQGTWKPFTGLPVPAFMSATGNGAIQVPIFTNAPLRGVGLMGTQIIVGYGSDATQMITEQKFKPIHVFAN